MSCILGLKGIVDLLSNPYKRIYGHVRERVRNQSCKYVHEEEEEITRKPIANMNLKEK